MPLTPNGKVDRKACRRDAEALVTHAYEAPAGSGGDGRGDAFGRICLGLKKREDSIVFLILEEIQFF